MSIPAAHLGRTPKPTEQKRLEAIPGSRPLNQNEPKPDIILQECPEHLDKLAKEEWERVFPSLYKTKRVSVDDRVALAAYCQSVSDWISASIEAVKHPRVVTTPNGALQTSPYVTQVRQAREDMIKIAAHFGFTPASRSRLSVSSDEERGEDQFQ